MTGGRAGVPYDPDRHGPHRVVGPGFHGRVYSVVERVPVDLPQPVEVSLLVKLEVIALELIGLITGSRWEPGDRRR